MFTHKWIRIWIRIRIEIRRVNAALLTVANMEMKLGMHVYLIVSMLKYPSSYLLSVSLPYLYMLDDSGAWSTGFT